MSVIGFVICKYRGSVYKKSGEATDASLEALVQEAYNAKLKDGTCKKRGDAFEARVDGLTRAADAKLKIGTKKSGSSFLR